tara:strand:- start:3787 stop:4272 length:486 start_codon:yes stop_codon:yes gene_type:complete
MGRKRVEDVKYTPTLSRHLLEGAFAQCMHQVLESLHMCRLHKETDMNLEQHVKGLKNITGSELATVLMITENRHSSTMIPKHKLWVKRAQTCYDDLLRLDNEDPENMKDPLRVITMWIQDAHLILHEDTSSEIREYLSNKGISSKAEEELLDGKIRVSGIQ